ncbi:MAG: hypothetical protein PHP22_09790 [Oscillospiraceae bacterium]|nr:hypothetical protein [Oscillospiraceae bacterium]
MIKNPGFFAFLNLYWKLTWKWFLGLIPGMAVLELGLLTFYINGGYRYLFFKDEENRNFWPTGYRGALESIRLEYILPVFAVILILFLVLTFNSLKNHPSSKFLIRIPVNLNVQILYRIGHSFIVFVSVWLVQFLILIAGFLIYRSCAPSDVNIDIQLFTVFAPPGLISVLFPITTAEYLLLSIPGFLFLILLPVFLSDAVQKIPAIKFVVAFIGWWILIIVYYFLRISLFPNAPSIMDDVMVFIMIVLVLWGMIRGLFLQPMVRSDDHDALTSYFKK